MAEKETRARQEAEELQRKKIEAVVQAQRIEEEKTYEGADRRSTRKANGRCRAKAS